MKTRLTAITLALIWSGAAWSTEKGLVDYYMFDEGQCAIVRDHSGMGHDGAINRHPKSVKSPWGVWLFPHRPANGQERAAAAGAKVYLRDDFESGKLDGWRWINSPQDLCHSEGQIEITQEETANGQHAVKFIDQAGDLGTYMWRRFSEPVGQGGDLYWRFCLKFRDNWRVLRGQQNHGGFRHTGRLASRFYAFQRSR